MKHSFYLTLATFLIKRDIRRKERLWRARIRRTEYDLPLHSAHLMRDIGLDCQGRPIVNNPQDAVQLSCHKVDRIRRRLLFRIPT